MRETLEGEFNLFCAKDVNTIFEEVRDILPELKPWNLEQSYILDEEKRVISTKIMNSDSKKEGYKVEIDAFLADTKYTLVSKSNYLSLVINYFEDGELIAEEYEVSYKDSIVRRKASYIRKDKTLYYKEAFNLENQKGKLDYDNSFDLAIMMGKMKERDEVRVRK